MFTCFRDYEAQSEDRVKNPQEYYHIRFFAWEITLKVTKVMDYYIECKGLIPREYKNTDRPMEKRHTNNKVKNYVKVGYYKRLEDAIKTFGEITTQELERFGYGLQQPDKDLQQKI